MSAQHQVETGMCGLPVDFRRVRKQDRNTLVWNVRSRLLDVVRTVEMRVVHPREIDGSGAGAYRDALVKEHANAKRFELRNHRDRIVVAEHSINVAAQRLTHVREDLEARLEIAVGAPAVITRQHAKIVGEIVREVGDPLHGGAAQVRMQIAQMQNGEAIESAWQICERHGVAPQLHLARVCPAAPIRSLSGAAYLDHRLHQGHVLQVQEVEPLAKSLCLVLALDAETQPRVQRSKSAFETALSFVGIK